MVLGLVLEILMLFSVLLNTCLDQLMVNVKEKEKDKIKKISEYNL